MYIYIYTYIESGPEKRPGLERASRSNKGAQGTVRSHERTKFFCRQRQRTLLPALQALGGKFSGRNLPQKKMKCSVTNKKIKASHK